LTNYHVKSFYGVETALIFTSPSQKIPYITLNCLKKKNNKDWEDLSKGEGKTIHLSMEEIICMLEVLKKKISHWHGYHVFREDKTEIHVGWEDESRQVVIFKIEDYVKKLRFPNLNFLTLLLEHVLSEKIIHATSGTREAFEIMEEKLKYEEVYGLFSEHITTRDGLQVVETTEYDIDIETVMIKAKIKVESPTALLIMLDSGEEFWIPKIIIHGKYDPKDTKRYQDLLVDKWILDKNKVKLD